MRAELGSAGCMVASTQVWLAHSPPRHAGKHGSASATTAWFCTSLQHVFSCGLSTVRTRMSAHPEIDPSCNRPLCRVQQNRAVPAGPANCTSAGSSCPPHQFVQESQSRRPPAAWMQTASKQRTAPLIRNRPSASAPQLSSPGQPVQPHPQRLPDQEARCDSSGATNKQGGMHCPPRNSKAQRSRAAPPWSPERAGRAPPRVTPLRAREAPLSRHRLPRLLRCAPYFSTTPPARAEPPRPR